jgi:hypothetical protein
MYAILLGIGSGAFALFLRSCMDERMIFRRYFLFLERIARSYPNLGYWLKPLGLCIYCMSEWVFIVLFLFSLGVNPGILSENVVLFSVGSGFNYLTIDFWLRICES